MFTDIEGSTRLAESMPARWPSLLERHRAIIRGALSANAGIEILTEGDGFFAVFRSAAAGVAAAVQAQRELAAEAWPSEAPIRVRMGLHSGEAVLDSDGSYIGHDVHRAARLGNAGHGGQILLSDSTTALVAHSLPTGTALEDLGEHRLKDLRPQRISQVVIDGLPSDFAPLRSLDARPNNLPVQVTSFIGRERELASAADLLARTRLLTLSGPGGTGKTRLALQLAADVSDQYPDGVWFVALEPLRDAQLVLPTVAHTLGIVPRPGQAAIDAIAGSVGDRRVLLVLDNLEQVIEAAGDVATLLRACAGITVVVTSRAVLRIAGEQEFVVPGLPAPPDTAALSRLELDRLPESLRRLDPATLDQYEAVRLFIARAQAALPAFGVTTQNAPAIAGITARLQGMPLAIELAAARIKLLSAEQILGRLERQLGFLTSTARDLPDRQRTLRGAIGWSYELLDEPHRRLLARLSVFRGGWDVETAETVAAAPDDIAPFDVLDGLAHLVDQSLVRRIDDDESVRFSMLETIREFALEMLEVSGDAERTASAHAGVFLTLAEQAAPELQGADQRRWLDRLERDHDNLRKAFAWFVGRPDATDAVRLTFALWRFWQKRGYLDEARRLMDSIAERVGISLPTSARGSPRLRAGWPTGRETCPRRSGGMTSVSPSAGTWLARTTRVACEDWRDALYNRGYTGVAEVMGGDRVDRRPDPASEG